MTRITEEPRARAISHHHECIVGYLVCHHCSPALVDVQSWGSLHHPSNGCMRVVGAAYPSSDCTSIIQICPSGNVHVAPNCIEPSRAAMLTLWASCTCIRITVCASNGSYPAEASSAAVTRQNPQTNCACSNGVAIASLL